MAISIGIEMIPSILIMNILQHFGLTGNMENRNIFNVLCMTFWDFKKSENSTRENIFLLSIDSKLHHKDIQKLRIV